MVVFILVFLWFDVIYRTSLHFFGGVVVVMLQRASNSHQTAKESVSKTHGFGMFAACVFMCCICIRMACT